MHLVKLEPSSESSLCLEPIPAMGMWPAEAGCLSKVHCMERTGAGGGCLEVGQVLVRLNFHMEILVPEQTEALAQLLLFVGLVAHAMKSAGRDHVRAGAGGLATYFAGDGCSPVGIFWWVSRLEVREKCLMKQTFVSHLCALGMTRRWPRSRSSHNHCTCRPVWAL